AAGDGPAAARALSCPRASRLMAGWVARPLLIGGATPTVRNAPPTDGGNYAALLRLPVRLRGARQRSRRAIRLDVSQRCPPIFWISEENWSTSAATGRWAPVRPAWARQIPRSLRIQSTAKPKSNLPAAMVL